MNLLQSFVRLVVEAANDAREPFNLSKPIVRRATRDELEGMYAVYHDFPLVATPWVQRGVGIKSDEVDSDGCCRGRYEVLIEYEVSGPDATRSRTGFGGSRWQPPDDDTFEVTWWMPFSIDGAVLSNEDAERLKAYIGPLSQEEVQGMLDDAAVDRSIEY